VEKPVFVDKIVVQEVEKLVYVDKNVYVDKIVHVDKVRGMQT
jgi:hypothetical protein